jgi:hypothetical protein
VPCAANEASTIPSTDDVIEKLVMMHLPESFEFAGDCPVAVPDGNTSKVPSTVSLPVFVIISSNFFCTSSLWSKNTSPEIVNVHSNYLFSIIEMKSMTASTLKGLIGSDVVHKRLLHKNEMNELRPLAFAIAAANKIPSIYTIINSPLEIYIH